MQTPETITNVVKPILIKKYKNRKLYNTSTSQYVTISELTELYLKGQSLIALDFNGKNITNDILLAVLGNLNKVAYGNNNNMEATKVLENQISQFNGIELG